MKTIISKIAKGINFNLSENWHDEYNNSHTNDDCPDIKCMFFQSHENHLVIPYYI